MPRRRHTRVLESFRLCTSVSVICPHFWLIKVFAPGVNGGPDLSCASGMNPLLLVTVGYGDLSRMKMDRVLWPSAQKIRDLAWYAGQHIRSPNNQPGSPSEPRTSWLLGSYSEGT